MTVYVLHFEPAYRHARHYIGWTKGTGKRRLREHLEGHGSPLIRAAVASGSSVRIAKLYRGAGRDLERALKQRRDVSQWCPLCGRNTRPVPSASVTTAFREKPRPVPVCDEPEELPF